MAGPVRTCLLELGNREQIHISNNENWNSADMGDSALSGDRRGVPGVWRCAGFYHWQRVQYQRLFPDVNAFSGCRLSGCRVHVVKA